jgi:hypothetical protein
MKNTIYLSVVFIAWLQTSLVYADTKKPEELKIYEPTGWSINSFHVKIKSGMMRHTYETNFTNKITNWYPWLGIGLKYQNSNKYGNFSIISNYSKSDTSTARDEQKTGISNTFGSTVLNREDYDINLAWSYNFKKVHSAVVFGGYKWSTTDVDKKGFVTGGESIGAVSFDPIQIETEGPFIGVGYSYKLQPSNIIIGTNVGYGRLEGERHTATIENVPPPPGKINALRYGTYITAPFSGKYENIFYTVNFDRYSYRLKDPTPENALDNSSPVDEVIYTIGFSIEYKFNF